MSKKTESASNTQSEKSTQTVSFDGVPCIVISCFNPDWENSDGDDNWYAVLPDADGTPTIVNLGLHGYNPKGVIRETAWYFLLNKDRIEDNRVEEYPLVKDTSNLKMIGFAIPRI